MFEELKKILQERKEKHIDKLKSDLRHNISAKRKALDSDDVSEYSHRIIEKVVESHEFKHAKTILIYYPLHNEVDTRLLLDQWQGEKQFILPVIKGSDIELHPYVGEDHMVVGKYGIKEPDTELYTGKVDLIIVPGVAFDKSRNRMGRGKGYYDRFLCHHEAPIFGLGYDFQLVKKLPVLSHDRHVTRVFTPNQIVG